MVEKIIIKFATINSRIETKRIPRGCTLGELAKRLEIPVQSLRVNGDKKNSQCVIKANDLIIAIDTEVAGA